MITIIEDQDNWKEAIKSYDITDTYHSHDYHTTEAKKNEKPILIEYKKRGFSIAIPLILRPIKNTEYWDATSTYGYSGPISKNIGPDFDNLSFIRALTDFFNKKKIITVFSRLNPFIPKQETILKGFGEILPKGKVVTIDLTKPIDIQRGLFQKRLKTHINKSRRHCEVKLGTTAADLEVFIQIYNENMDRLNAKSGYYFDKQYYQKIFSSKEFETMLLLAVEKDTQNAIAGSMFFIKGDIIQYHLSGTKTNFLHLMPNKLLIDEMRIIGSENSKSILNLGGGLGGSTEDNLFRFKSSFSKQTKEFKVWNLIVNKKIYSDLIRETQTEGYLDFFPKYRAIG